MHHVLVVPSGVAGNIVVLDRQPAVPLPFASTGARGMGERRPSPRTGGYGCLRASGWSCGTSGSGDRGSPCGRAGRVRPRRAGVTARRGPTGRDAGRPSRYGGVGRARVRPADPGRSPCSLRPRRGPRGVSVVLTGAPGATRVERPRELRRLHAPTDRHHHTDAQEWPSVVDLDDLHAAIDGLANEGPMPGSGVPRPCGPCGNGQGASGHGRLCLPLCRARRETHDARRPSRH